MKKMVGPGGIAIEVDDATLDDWIVEGFLLVVDELRDKNPDLFVKSSTTSLVINQQEYGLPSDFEKILLVNIKLDGAWYTARPLPLINGIPVFSRGNDNAGFTASDPYYYLLGDEIGLMPIPTASVANGLKIWYSYDPAEPSATEEPDIPARFHRILKYWAYASYLDQKDEHVAAERMRQRFEGMLEKLANNYINRQVQESRSVQITSEKDLYYLDSTNV